MEEDFPPSQPQAAAPTHLVAAVLDQRPLPGTKRVDQPTGALGLQPALHQTLGRAGSP